MALCELAVRAEAGLVVRLLWDPARGQAVLRYRDRREGDAFAVDVPNGRALEAFYHPNAYRPARLVTGA
ncbi:MAG: hypothetical protein ICV71_08110 [Thermoleophilia bacterium]|jgi:hypothetical protein|nr:hypothetical protein [Thermoleophilia bacterium]MDQ3858595.1 hypothetical protein [Actinomycetota bacterium]